MGKALRRKLAVLLLAAQTAGCSSFSGSSLTGWMPGAKKKPEQGLSWATPEMSKSYGNNQIGATRGGTFEPRTEMPKPPQEEGRLARMTSVVTRPVKAVTAAFKKPSNTTTVTAGGAAGPGLDPKADPKKEGAAVYASVAQVQEKQGNIAAAAEGYERALQADSKNLEALLGYARLKDRQGDLAQATQLYQVASRLHPTDATAYNDLGLCLSRQGKTQEAQAALTDAVRLRPERKLYRNNLAKLLVDAGQPQQAFAQLSAAHPPAAAHYNIGYLLQQKSDLALARHHFARALEIDPSLADARQWLATIDGLQVATAPPGPTEYHGAYLPASTSGGTPASLPVHPTQPRTSMGSEFYSPNRY